MAVGIQLFEVIVTGDNNLNEPEDTNVSVEEDDDSKSNPWFGYIGLGIALLSMVIGLIGVVAAVFF